MEVCTIKRHPLRAAKAAAIPSWPSYSGMCQLVGSTADGRVTVYVDSSLGAAGLENAQDLLADAPRIVKANDALFGTTGGPVNVIVFALWRHDGRHRWRRPYGVRLSQWPEHRSRRFLRFVNSCVGVVRGRTERVLDGRELVR